MVKSKKQKLSFNPNSNNTNAEFESEFYFLTIDEQNHLRSFSYVQLEG